MVQPCDLCQTVVSFDEDYKQDFVVKSDYFHQECASCDSTELCDLDLCAWCKHLRLRHLIKCVQVYDMWPRPHFYVRRDLLENSSALECPLCRIFSHILLSMSHRLPLGALSECCMELSLDNTDDSVRGWFTSNKLDDLIGPMFYVHDAGSVGIIPLITENVSWDSLQVGMRYCLEHHKACRNDGGLQLPLGFRVIDVQKQCISELQSRESHFFALSYVWGRDDSPHSKTTKANFEAFTALGALSQVQLPQTVQDAMTACSRLGQRYLWVDRLCIVQDSPDDKANQIAAMDQIYRSAQYVIVAYGSENMHSGLSGISRPRPQTQMRVHLSGLTLTSDGFDDFCDQAFKGCVWLGRGWTYQEFELARRKLCFRNTTAFLECRHGRKEEYHHGFGDNGEEDQTARRISPLFSQYTTHLEAYSQRRLTFYSDAIAAITGVLQWLYEDKNDILHGLPAVHFDRALLWFGDPIEMNRPLNTTFPSWSWASVLGGCGKLQFRDALWRGRAGFRSYEFCGTLIPWYTRGIDGKIRPINTIADDQLCTRWRSYAAIACEAGCVANLTNDPANAAERWPDYDSYRREVIPTRLEGSEAILGLPENLHSLMGENVLLTLAQTATLDWKTNQFSANTGVSLLSTDGGRIGEIEVRLEDQSQYSQLPTQWGKKVEVMGVSLSILTAPGEGASWPSGKFVDVEGQTFPDIPVVHVFVVGRKGRYTQRKQLGWVCLTDWIKVEKTWEYILLE